jgi:hypothetical protein
LEPWGKEVLALLRILDVCFYELQGRPITVYTQTTVLQWATSYKKTKKDYIDWSIRLAAWDITYIALLSDDTRLYFAALLTTSMAPPHTVVDDLAHLCPSKALARLNTSIIVPILPSFTATDTRYIATFDGGLKVSASTGSWGYIIWQLPDWNIIAAESGLIENPHITANISEYHGCLNALRCAIRLKITDLILFGDSNLVIKQLTDVFQCHAPGLKILLKEHALELTS